MRSGALLKALLAILVFSCFGGVLECLLFSCCFLGCGGIFFLGHFLAQAPGPRGPVPWAKGPGPLGQGARAHGPRGPGPWAKGPGSLGQGAWAPGPRGPKGSRGVPQGVPKMIPTASLASQELLRFIVIFGPKIIDARPPGVPNSQSIAEFL